MVTMAFRPETVYICVDKILPLKKIKPSVKKTKKYRQIHSSIKEVGIIEHLIIYPQDKKSGLYLLLDGHIRFEVLKEIGQKKVHCLVSTDDEGFTYNHKVSRLSSIQEHFMILRAIDKGVSEERIAETLNVNIAKIREKRDLLKGICPEIPELFKDRNISPRAFAELRKMTPMRQIEVAELMIATNNFTVPYAKALLASTPKDQLIDHHKQKKISGLSSEDLARMEKETELLERDFMIIKESYGEDTLNLVLSTAYLSKILNNARMVRFLSKNYPDILSEFQRIIEVASLGHGT
jgi:ParB-like chromosome segregation protein Spo0J